MKISSTIKLLLGLIVLSLVLWRLEAEKKPELVDRQSLFEGIEMDDVNYLFCRRDAAKAECSKKEHGWFMKAPVRARANTAVIMKLLGMAEGLTVRESITSEQRIERDLDLADYGLQDPSSELKLGGGYFLKEMQIGDAAPVGDAVYVRFKDEDVVLAVDGAITNLMPPDLELFRDPHILPGDPTKTTRIELQQPGGFVQLVRKGDAWQIQQPFAAQADGEMVESILNALFSLRAVKYVWDPPAQETLEDRVKAGALHDLYGFADDIAIARITIWQNGDEIGREVVFGNTIKDREGLVYAKRKAFDSVFAVRRVDAPLSGFTAVDLRDKLLFPVEPTAVRELGVAQGDTRVVLHKDPESGWNVTEPVKWQADDDYVNQLVSILAGLKVSEFTSSSLPEDLTSLRLDPPEFQISLSIKDCAAYGDRQPVDSKKGTDIESSCCSDMVMVGFPGSNGVRNIAFSSGQMATISEESLGVVDVEKLVNPLQYRDRTVLSLSSRNVRRIELDAGGREERIALSSNEVWHCTSESNRQVNIQVVQDLLLITANLRAISFESLNPKNLSGYGLEPPAVALTLGLSGDDGIQKTIMLGFVAGTEGIYGLIKGQDLLLILEKNVANLLSRSLLMPAEADGKSSSENARSDSDD